MYHHSPNGYVTMKCRGSRFIKRNSHGFFVVHEENLELLSRIIERRRRIKEPINNIAIPLNISAWPNRCPDWGILAISNEEIRSSSVDVTVVDGGKVVVTMDVVVVTAAETTTDNGADVDTLEFTSPAYSAVID
jgi:hypothetical protein